MWVARKLMMMVLPDPFTFGSFVVSVRGFFLRPRTTFLRVLDFGLKSPNVVSFISLSIPEDKFPRPQKSFPLPTKFAGLFAAAVMYALNAVVPALSISPRKCQGKAGIQYGGRIHLIQCSMAVPGMQSQLFLSRRLVSPEHRLPSAAVICSASLNARCGAEQTQTVTRQSSTITIAPIQGKEKSPELDDGGTGFPPRDDGDGGGGGGGGGGGWSGGFFFFGLLAFLGFLKDQESEGPYKNNRRS